MTRWLLILALILAPVAHADVTVPTQIDPIYDGETITAVAYRGTTVLATASCTHDNDSGVYWAIGTLDLSGAGAGYVRVAFIDENNQPVSQGAEFEIDASGDQVDRLPFLDHSVATVDGIADGIKAKTDHLPSAAAGSNGGLPTVDANNRIAGIQGTITTLDGLDTAQDAQHTATQNALSTIDSNVDSILEDTGTTLPGTLSGLATSAALTSVGNNVTAILEDTSTTLPGTLSTIGSNVTSILEDTGTTLPGTLSTIDGNVDAILEDTGTTLPGTLAGLATQASVNTIDGIVDNIYTAFELNSGSYRLTSDAVANIGAVSLEPEDIDAIAEATALAVGEDIGESVWTYDGDRLLTAGTNIVLAKGTGITGFNDVSVADIWTEGVSSYNDVATFGGIVKGTSNTVTTIYDHTSSMSSTGVVVATGGITTASFATGAITQEVFDDEVELGGGLTAEQTRAALGLASANLDAQFSGLSDDITGLDIEQTAYTKDSASKSRTWSFTPNTERITSPNTITEAAAFNGEVCFDLTNAMNPGAGILSIASVTVIPSSGVTVGTPAKTSDNKKAIVNVSGHTAGTTYTYTITVSTTDGDTALVRKGVFVAE